MYFNVVVVISIIVVVDCCYCCCCSLLFWRKHSWVFFRLFGIWQIALSTIAGLYQIDVSSLYRWTNKTNYIQRQVEWWMDKWRDCWMDGTSSYQILGRLIHVLCWRKACTKQFHQLKPSATCWILRKCWRGFITDFTPTFYWFQNETLELLHIENARLRKDNFRPADEKCKKRKELKNGLHLNNLGEKRATARTGVFHGKHTNILWKTESITLLNFV